MPSQPANDLSNVISDAIGRPLDAAENLKVEEICINVFPGAALNWAKRWTAQKLAKQKTLTVDWYHKPLLNGIIPNAMKRKGNAQFHFDTDGKRNVYASMHAYLGTGFSAKALDIIVWLCEWATQAEVDMAISVAQYHGVVNHAYVRAIIVGNRRKVTAQMAAHDARFKKITNDPPDVLTGVPNVKSIQDAWAARLKKAVADQEERTVTDAAKRKLTL